MGRRHGGFGGPIRFGSGSAGLARAQQLRPDQLEQLLGFPSVDQVRIEERERRKALARAMEQPITGVAMVKAQSVEEQHHG